MALRVVCFAVLAHGWSWLLWLGATAYVRGWTDVPVPPGAVELGFFGPSLAAGCVTAAFGGRAAIGALLERLVRWRLPWAVYGLALLGPPVILLIASAVAISRGECCRAPVPGRLSNGLGQRT